MGHATMQEETGIVTTRGRLGRRDDSSEGLRVLGRADQGPPAREKDRAEREERHIPRKFVRAGPNVVDLEDVVVDHTLDQVEETPADPAPRSRGRRSKAGIGSESASAGPRTSTRSPRAIAIGSTL